MKILINYADEPYKPAQHYATKKAYSVGKVDKVVEYGPEDIDENFKKENKSAFIQNNKRVGKYGLWRPYIVMDALNNARDDDYIIYCDSGAYFVKPVDILIDFMEKKKTPLLLFNSGYRERQLTKRDIFVYLDAEQDNIVNSIQRVSGFFIVKKNDETVSFFSEWLGIATKAPYLFTDEENRLGKENYDGFIDTKHNQSVLSVLSKKYGYPAYRNPSHWGWGQGIFGRLFRWFKAKHFDKEGGYYPTIFLLHRSKKVTPVVLIGIKFQSWFPRSFKVVNKIRKRRILFSS